MKLNITVHGVSYEVDVEILDDDQGYQSALPMMPNVPDYQSPLPSAPSVPRPAAKRKQVMTNSSGSITSPIAGIVLEIKCAVGNAVKEGDIVMILEAMKMKTSIAAPVDGTVKAIPVSKGDNIREGEILVEFE
ncbi:MAG: acetyl-CoA carboxylase biotin carboxyl carrier protein subunit [Denitrovibrio sp.]|nr:MAG: acetyl-CoA carboxylase biotin carboxyl carrier protein subunit [Denitrovibrio sp.]